MAVRTWVGRFCVASGRVEEEGPWLGSLIRQRPDDEADELYTLVEPAGPGSDEYATQLVDVIGSLYQRDPLSLTGALTRSMRAAHDHLREWNRKSLKEHRVGAGASCLALRGREAYLAQVGPSLAYLLPEGGELRRITPHDDDAGPLGVADRFEPRITRRELEPGDLLLVLSSKLDLVVSQPMVERILRRGADEALPELYTLCKDEADSALVLLSCFERADELPDFLSRDGDDSTTSAEAGVGEASLESDRDEALRDGRSTSTAVLTAPGVDAPPAASASVGVADASDFTLPPRPAHEQVRDITASTAPAPGANVRIRGGAAAPRYKRTTGGGMPQIRVPRLVLFAAAAVAAVILIGWWQLPRSREESREEDFAALIADARESNARAQATGDAGTKRQLLTEAQADLTDAGKIHADNGELLALSADVTAAIGVLDAVYEVRDFSTVIDLAQQATGALAVTQTVIGGGNAYLLDAEDRRVLRVPLEGEPEVLFVLEEGQVAGEVTPGRPTALAWSEQVGGLFILDDLRQVFVYVPTGGLLPLIVRGADTWGSADAIATADGNLYVLDAGENQVWRYLPGEPGFDSERAPLISGATLSDATEVAVGADIYVLDREAGIRRFSGRDEVAFPLAGIDRPLMEPASLSVLPGSNRVVVADRANKRIIVASPDGAFLKQIISPSFTDLRAVAVDEGTGTLYVLNGDTLLEAAFAP